MDKIISMTLLSLLILCSGCIRSLHPIYTEQDIVFEPSLIGQWSEDNSKEVWTFSRKEPNSYTLVYTDDQGKQGSFSAHLAKIKNSLFLDFFPEEPELKENDFYKFHLLPVHTFLYVKQIEPTLQMSFPDPEWLEKFIADNPNAIQNDSIDGDIILTASTEDLQAFWLKHLKTEGAFGESSNMKLRTSTLTEEQPTANVTGSWDIYYYAETKTTDNMDLTQQGNALRGVWHGRDVGEDHVDIVGSIHGMKVSIDVPLPVAHCRIEATVTQDGKAMTDGTWTVDNGPYRGKHPWRAEKNARTGVETVKEQAGAK